MYTVEHPQLVFIPTISDVDPGGYSGLDSGGGGGGGGGGGVF